MSRSAGRIALQALFGASLLTACYRPELQDAGLRCGDGGTCPDGYHCGGDRRCHKGDKAMCLPDAGVVVPLCNDQPLVGDQCDPICQQGCECGRCNLRDDKLDCVPAGNKVAGDICNLGKDDCAAGLVCLNELCPEDPDAGQQVGRCYRYCAGDQHCDGMSCNVPIMTTVVGAMRACQLPPRACDPVNATTTCGSPLLGCYVESNGRLSCECPGTAVRDEPCDFLTDCAPGFRCVREGGAATPRCRRVCRLNGTDCMSGGTCTGTPGDATFGYCTP